MWNFDPHAETCEQCRETFELYDDIPYCESDVGCDRPPDIEPLTITAIEIWRLCDQTGRDLKGNIRTEALLEATEYIGGSTDDVDAVLKLDQIWKLYNRKKVDGDEEGRGEINS